MSWKGATGPGMFRGNIQEIIDRLSIQYGVERNQILLGNTETPPNAPECVLFASVESMGGGYTCVTVWIREGRREEGTWINESMRDPDFDLRK